MTRTASPTGPISSVSPPLGTNTRIKLRNLLLDAKNPRLAEFGIEEDASQPQLVETLWRAMDVEEVAMSIAHSGYFDYEPLFVEQASNGRDFVVIEGNRRLAAVRILTDPELRKKLRATHLPKISQEGIAKLQELPAIITTRKASWRYLGFKHVNGPATWRSYAKAQYVAHVHNEYKIPLSDIAEQIGDSNSTVKRMYRGLMIVEQAESTRVFTRADIAKNRFFFNYIYTGMDYPGISSFLGLGSKGTTERRPVPPSRKASLGELFLWMYGSESRGIPSLIRSQNPDLKDLDEVLMSEAGIQALRAGLPLEVAHDISLGDENVFRHSLQRAKQNLQKALGTMTTGYSTGDVDALKLAREVEELVHSLIDGMTSKRRTRDRRSN